jgi:uncharacterized membrane protein (UPF0136 family)
MVAHYYIAFGLVSAALGYAAWHRVKSRASLIAGSLSGILLIIIGGLMLSGWPELGNIFGIALCLALAGRFVPGFIARKKFYPDGLMAALALIGVIFGLISLLG